MLAAAVAAAAVGGVVSRLARVAGAADAARQADASVDRRRPRTPCARRRSRSARRRRSDLLATRRASARVRHHDPLWAPRPTRATPAPTTRTRPARNVAERRRSARRRPGAASRCSLRRRGSRTTPLTDDRAGRLRGVRGARSPRRSRVQAVIVGNEPNLNRFWLPQFGAGGHRRGRARLTGLLARSYDAIKAVTPIRARARRRTLAARRRQPPGGSRPTHSPTAFIRDLGAAYRRERPDAPDHGRLRDPPVLQDNSSRRARPQAHPNNTTIALADYDKLVALLGEAFGGTAQPARRLPIYYGEFGLRRRPAGRSFALRGHGPRPTDRQCPSRCRPPSTGARSRSSFCQPTVRGLFVFHTVRRAGPRPAGSPASTSPTARRSESARASSARSPTCAAAS